MQSNRTRRASGTTESHLTDIALLGICAVCLVVAGVTAALTPAAPDPAGWAAVTVPENATLWDIARSNPVPGLSTAETVAAIRAHNGLESAVVLVGQSLQVPYVSPVAEAVAQR